MPLSENVEVYLDEGGHYASVQYGGYSNNSKRLRYTKALKEKLKEHNIESFGDFFFLIVIRHLLIEIAQHWMENLSRIETLIIFSSPTRFQFQNGGRYTF